MTALDTRAAAVPVRKPSVLVVAYDFPPHAAIGTMRTLRVVRQLDAAGWQVTVLTSDPAHYLSSTPVDPALLTHVPAGVKVLRAGPIRWWDKTFEVLKTAAGKGSPAAAEAGPGVRSTSGARPGQGPLRWIGAAKDVVDAALSIPDREIGWLLPAVATGVAAGRPDVIYSSAPPWTGQLVAGCLQRVLRTPWVADFRDPWSRAPWRGDRYRFAIRAAAALERWVVGRADRILFVADGNRADFSRHYGDLLTTKFSVVPNGCDPAEFDALERPNGRSGGPHVMLHAGSLYAGRTPVPVLKALARALQAGLIDRSAFRLRFLGANAVTTDLPAACRDLGIEDVVEFSPRVPRSDGLRAMVAASSLLLLQPGHTVSVPGKVYEYLAVGRPIFALAEEGETADIVRRSGIGVSVTPDDEASILDGLVAVVRMGASDVPPPARALYDGYVGAETIVRFLGEALRRA